MALFLLYIIKSSICLTIFYLFFILVMRSSTFFRFNRITLLTGTLACMLLPFFSITVSEKQLAQMPIQALSEILDGDRIQEIPMHPETSAAIEGMLTKEASPAFCWSPASVTGGIYIIGTIITLGFILSSFLRMWQIIRNAPRKRENGYWLIVVPYPVHSFSFGKYIVLTEEDYQQNSIILTHEQMHLRYHHTLDSLWFMIITILYWFNPVVWLMRLEMQQLHEYEADEGVIKQGIDATQYQLLLVKKAVGTRLYSMANGFNHSKLKKRITMMLKERTNGWARLKLLIVVPVVMGTMLVFAHPEVKETLEDVIPATLQKNDEPQDLIAMKNFFSQEMEKNKITLQEAKAGIIHTFYVNQDHQMLFDQKHITQNEIAGSVATSFLNKAANYYRKTEKYPIQSISITYDIAANEYIIYKYLCEIKRGLEYLPEFAPQMELDNSKEKWPVIVFFEAPRSYSKEAGTKRYTHVEVTLYDGDKAIKMSNFTENELKDKFAELTPAPNGDRKADLKMKPDATTEEVARIKELLRLLYNP